MVRRGTGYMPLADEMFRMAPFFLKKHRDKSKGYFTLERESEGKKVTETNTST